MTIRECYDELGLDFDETFNTSISISPLICFIKLFFIFTNAA